MKTLTAFALLLMFGLTANAQQSQQPPVDQSSRIRRELLELEQETDKMLLRESFLILGRKELRPLAERPADDRSRNLETQYLDTLNRFIEDKKKAMVERAAAMDELRAVPSNRVATSQPSQPKGIAVEQHKQSLIAKYTDAEVESQLLQKKSELFQNALNQAIEKLADAELAASNDESRKPELDAARKLYDKVKSIYAENSKKLLSAQNEIFEIQQSGAFPRFGGMGGMGGGMR